MTDFELSLSEQARIRRAKLEELKASGRDPYLLTSFLVTHKSADILDGFEALEGKTVTIAGRMTTQRIMGKATFAHLLDSAGKIQIYAKNDDLGSESYNFFKTCDLGDLMGVTGEVFKTRMGEISVHAREITLLAKSLWPLPEKFHGLKDNDLRYRQRYVDMIVNPEAREAFIKRTRLVTMIRREMDGRGYIEVETPVLHNKPTNSAARPFKTHHNTLDIDMYMRVETELALKRLIVGGFDRVYEIGRLFRNEGMDTTHNPEFTTIEMYEAFTDYNGMMELCEHLFHTAAVELCGSAKIEYQGHEVDFTPPFARITMADAVEKYAGIDFSAIETDEQAEEAVKKAGLEPPKGLKRGELLAFAFDEMCEERIIQPTFVCDYPIEISPLAKKKPGDPRIVERFELFICGGEKANAFTELNDPIDQRERFIRQAQIKNPEGQFEVDEDFLTAIEYGMPPTGGMGIGIDRMAMLFSNSASIRDVLLFPTMRPKD